MTPCYADVWTDLCKTLVERPDGLFKIKYGRQVTEVTVRHGNDCVVRVIFLIFSGYFFSMNNRCVLYVEARECECRFNGSILREKEMQCVCICVGHITCVSARYRRGER